MKGSGVGKDEQVLLKDGGASEPGGNQENGVKQPPPRIKIRTSGGKEATSTTKESVLRRVRRRSPEAGAGPALGRAGRARSGRTANGRGRRIGKRVGATPLRGRQRQKSRGATIVSKALKDGQAGTRTGRSHSQGSLAGLWRKPEPPPLGASPVEGKGSHMLRGRKQWKQRGAGLVPCRRRGPIPP